MPKNKAGKDLPSLNQIFGQLDRGEITTEQAAEKLQEHRKANTSRLDRILAFLAG